MNIAKLTVGSLFSGIGGIESGFEKTGGFEVKWQCEIEPYARAVLRKHWPNIPCYEDIYKLCKTDNPEQVDVVVGGFPCFVRGTLIETKEGYRNIEDVRVGDSVRTHNNRFEKVLYVMTNPPSRIIKIHNPFGLPLEATPDHPFLARKRTVVYEHGKPRYVFSEEAWVEAKDLTTSHYLSSLYSNKVDEASAKSVEFWHMVGRWLGDGWVQNQKRKSKIPQGNRGSRINSYNWKIIICTGIKDADNLEKIISDAGYHATKSVERTVVKFIICSKELLLFLKSFGNYAMGKKIPGYVYDLPIEKQRSFYEGWIGADGYETENCIRGTTISKEMAVGMAQVARNCYRKNVTIGETVRNKTRMIEGRIVNQHNTFEVYVWKNSRSVIINEGDKQWKRIKKIEQIVEEKITYNLQVEGDESYVAEGCIVHNCPKFSRAGKRGGFEEDGLFYEMLRVCNALKPKYIVFENVEGFKDFKEELRGQVENIGYEWEDALLDSRKFGVPQSRVRYFAVCVRRGELPSSQYLRGIQRNESESIQRIQSDIANPKGRWAHTVSSKEDWRTIFANSRRSRNNSRISNGMDRIRCLGNAVSPIVAEEIARAILIYEIGDVVT